MIFEQYFDNRHGFIADLFDAIARLPVSLNPMEPRMNKMTPMSHLWKVMMARMCLKKKAT